MIGFLYGQTEYSILNNALFLDDYINFAKQEKYSFLTITDENMHGYYKFYTKCMQNNIKPIIGLKIIVENVYIENTALLLYAKNKIGFQNLLKISSNYMLNKKPFSLEELKKYKDGLIAVTSGIDSEIDKLIFLGKEDSASQIIDEYKMIFEDDFYLGLMVQSFKTENMSASMIERLANEKEVLVVPLSKTLYYHKYDKELYEYLCKIDGRLANIEDDDYSLKTKEELEQDFIMYPYVFDNLEKLISTINFALPETKVKLPTYPNKMNMSSHDFLRYLTQKGLKRRLLINQINDQTKYFERLNHELQVIEKMGYEDYFLIVYDFVNYAKKNDVLVGPGRGSAAGSLVSYSLGIVDIDPIKYDLLFERFLNPERISMPDIDLDFPDDKRDFVIGYVQEKYGKNRVCNITTFGTFQTRSSIRDVARCMKMELVKVDEIVKMLQVKTVEELKIIFNDDQEIYKLLDIASRIEGLPRHISTHAAGIILSSDNLTDVIPIQEGINGLYQSQLEASDLEALGLLKIDFLGIKNLQMIHQMTSDINKITPFDIRKINLNDKKTYELLSNADTVGIFQLESAGIKNVLRKLKPSTFEDVVAVLALYRPGAMDNIDEFIARKNGKKFKYLHPDLEPILKNTYGIIVYQEQIMMICYQFVGYSLGEADLLRRAIGKKREDIMQKERSHFIEKCINKGHTLELANELYNYILKFANYGFNRSHSVCYALVSYQMAYIKANYLPIFMKHLMNNTIGNEASLKEYINYCLRNKITVLPPNINISTTEFEERDNKLYMPLQAIKGIGINTVIDLLNERQDGFVDYNDFKQKTFKVISNRVFEGLIFAGALDCFGHSKKYMHENMGQEVVSFNKYLDVIIDESEYQEDFLITKEKEYLGFNIRYDLFKNITDLYKKFQLRPFNYLKKQYDNVIIGQILSVKSISTKKQEPMAFVKVNDGFTEVEGVIFPKNYNEVITKIKKDCLMFITLDISIRNNIKQMVIKDIKEL